MQTLETHDLAQNSTNTSQISRSICPYCGVGCGLKVESQQLDGRLKVVGVKGDPAHPANFGALCSKGATLPQILDMPHRLRYPQIQSSRTEAFEPVSWDIALEEVASKFKQIIAEHGTDAVAFYGSGQLLTEDYYVAQKLVKGFLGTNNFDTNSRLCMSSSVAAYQMSLGQDGPPANYADLEEADCFFIVGANMAACHPILFNRLRSRKKRGDSAVQVIVADPRRTNTAAIADHYLPLKPGGDVALLNSMLYVLHQENLLDRAFIEKHTEGWQALAPILDRYAPETVEEETGLTAAQIRTAALAFGRAKAALSLWSMGVNQSTAGVDKARALLNLHLATGQIGKVGAGPFSLTGQPNAMGGREAGGLSHLLPGHRFVADASHRAEVEKYWGLLPGSIAPQPGLSAVELFQALEQGRVKAVWIMATNPAASFPDLAQARRALHRAELVVVQDAYFPTETGELAHVLLPAAQWAERTGTMTNSERRVSLLEQSSTPVGASRPDWQILAAFAHKLGFGAAFNWRDSAAVFEEFKGLTAGRDLDMSGMSYARLREGSLQWPCPTSDHPGTPRLYTDNRFPTDNGKARFATPEYHNLAEPPDDAYPFVLTTGRVRDQWHTMTRTGYIPTLLKVESQPFVEINSTDAANLQIADGQLVEVCSRRGRLVVPASVNDRIVSGTVFMPFHWGKLHYQGGEAGFLNELTLSDYDQQSKEPELKACAVVLKPYF